MIAITTVDNNDNKIINISLMETNFHASINCILKGPIYEQRELSIINLFWQNIYVKYYFVCLVDLFSIILTLLANIRLLYGMPKKFNSFS